MNLKIKRLHPEAILPKYALPQDAGMDFYALENNTILPQERKLIFTGISLAIPLGYVGLIWDKSGIATKYGIKTMAGVIDSGYRGEIKILLYNSSTEIFKIEKGQKIAQILIQPVQQFPLEEVQNLDETERDADGFGSTGLK